MHPVESWKIITAALTQAHALAFTAALITLVWEAQEQRSESKVILGLTLVSALHIVFAYLSADVQCWYASATNLLAGVHVGASAVARGTSGKGWSSRYRWRWNLRSMVGVGLSWIAVARCFELQ